MTIRRRRRALRRRGNALRRRLRRLCRGWERRPARRGTSGKDPNGGLVDRSGNFRPCSGSRRENRVHRRSILVRTNEDSAPENARVHKERRPSRDGDQHPEQTGKNQARGILHLTLPAWPVASPRCNTGIAPRAKAWSSRRNRARCRMIPVGRDFRRVPRSEGFRECSSRFL